MSVSIVDVKRLVQAVVGIAALSICQAVYAIEDIGDWITLQKVQQASQRLNYQGTLIIQSGSHVSSSRVTHFIDATGEYERIELLDGKPREWIRFNDEVQSINPETKVIRQEKRRFPEKFPSLLSANVDELAQYYSIKPSGGERVAGVDCSVLELEPKDALRYGYRFWVDRSNGLIMRSQTLSETREVIEQVAFSDFRILPQVDKQKPRLKVAGDGWKLEVSHSQPSVQAPANWIIKPTTPGFKKITELKRIRPSGREVNQLIYSDGLASVSLFIEPYDPNRVMPGPIMNHGAVRSQSRRIGDWTLIAMGEVPALTIKQFISAIDVKN